MRPPYGRRAPGATRQFESEGKADRAAGEIKEKIDEVKDKVIVAIIYLIRRS